MIQRAFVLEILGHQRFAVGSGKIDIRVVVPVLHRARNFAFYAIDVGLPYDVRDIAQRDEVRGLQMSRLYDLAVAAEAEIADVCDEELLQRGVLNQKASLLADLKMSNRSPVLSAFGGWVLDDIETEFPQDHGDRRRQGKLQELAGSGSRANPLAAPFDRERRALAGFQNSIETPERTGIAWLRD